MLLHGVSLVDAHRDISLSEDFVVENVSIDSPIATINAIDPFESSDDSYSDVNHLTYSLTLAGILTIFLCSRWKSAYAG